MSTALDEARAVLGLPPVDRRRWVTPWTDTVHDGRHRAGVAEADARRARGWALHNPPPRPEYAALFGSSAE